MTEEKSWKKTLAPWVKNLRVVIFRKGAVDVSENSGTPKSSILIGCSVINHPFWGTPIFGNTQVDSKTPCLSLKIQQLQNHVEKGTRSCFIIDTS